MIRQGSLLIVVAGISALFMSTCLVFIAHMRSDAEESRMMRQEAQAHIMLNAALHYVQEASRLGWDDPATPEHEESFGWLDVRDGLPGPRGMNGEDLARVTDRFPAPGYAARCPMFLYERPPFALKQTFTYNPAPHDPSRKNTQADWAALVSMKEADPQPAALTWLEFKEGDRRIRTNSLGLAWFRAFRHRDDLATPRDERATFTLTCGSGGTMGFYDWSEVVAANAQLEFNNDPSFFGELRNQERLLFYEVEWSPAVGGSGSVAKQSDSFQQIPVNGTAEGWWAVRGFVGSFLYIQRLEQVPTEW